MMNLFLILLVGISTPSWAQNTSLEQITSKLARHYKIAKKINVQTDAVNQHQFQTASFDLRNLDFRIVIQNQTHITLSKKKESDLAFTLVAQTNIPISKMYEWLVEHIDTEIQEPKSTLTFDLKNRSIFGDEEQSEQTEISTSQVLSWNRLLSNAYKGENIGSGLGDTSGEGGSLSGSDVDQASSMANMMNQCGGSGKSNFAHKEAMKDIAKALVMSRLNPHDVARASQSYTDQSKDYERKNKKSVLDLLNQMQDVDQAKLYRNIQLEKRNIHRAMLKNDLSIAFGQDSQDQTSQKLLQNTIDQYGTKKATALFNQSTRKLVIDPSYFELFAKQPDKAVHFDFQKRVWVLNPLLDSDILWRKALVECLWKWPDK